MTEMDRQIRELLAQRADTVPLHREIPTTLLRRARRRIALNALAVGTTVVVLAAGAFAGVRVLTAPESPVPGGHGPTPSVQPTPSVPPTTSACTSGQLRAVGSMEGAAGSRMGSIGLTNLSDQTCTLEGTPTITLLDQNFVPITDGVAFESSPPGWSVEGSPEPPGWPVVTLAPGDSASVRVRWSNWCPDGRAAPLWRMQILGAESVDVNGLDAVPPPPCNGPGQPSTVEVGPFEPGPGA